MNSLQQSLFANYKTLFKNAWKIAIEENFNMFLFVSSVKSWLILNYFGSILFQNRLNFITRLLEYKLRMNNSSSAVTRNESDTVPKLPSIVAHFLPNFERLLSIRALGSVMFGKLKKSGIHLRDRHQENRHAQTQGSYWAHGVHQ